MSFGVHRLWKQFALSLTGLRAGQSRARCRRGHRRSDARGWRARWARPGGWSCRTSTGACSRPAATGCWIWVTPATSTAWSPTRSACPSPTDCFDCVTIGFGLRNVTDKAAALVLHVPGVEARRPAPGAGVLDARRAGPEAAVRRLFVQRAAAAWDDWVAKDAASYRYLAESIRMHPDQETLLGMLEGRGLRRRRVITISRAASSPSTADTKSNMPATPVWLAAVESILNRSIGALAQSTGRRRAA